MRNGMLTRVRAAVVAVSLSFGVGGAVAFAPQAHAVGPTCSEVQAAAEREAKSLQRQIDDLQRNRISPGGIYMPNPLETALLAQKIAATKRAEEAAKRKIQQQTEDACFNMIT